MSGIYGYPTDPAQTSGTVGTSAGEAGTIITEDATQVKALNNAMRGIAGDLGNFRDDISAANSTASASGTAYVLATSSQINALGDGIRLTWLPDADNTGAATLNVDTLGAKKLLHDSAVLVAGEIKAGHPVDCVYDASADSAAGAWLVLNPITAALSSDNVTNDSGVTGATVTAALDQLNTDKLDESAFDARTLTAGTGLTGGGDLSDDRNLAIDIASQAEAEAGTDNAHVMTPLRTKQAIDALAGGTVLGRAYAETATYAALTAAIPYDDTIPQSTEGTEVLSLVYSPRRATSKIRCGVLIPVNATTTAVEHTVAIFNGGAEAIGVGAGIMGPGSTYSGQLFAEAIYEPGDTEDQNISVRVGPVSGTMHFLGNTTGRRFGGVAKAFLIVEEVEP